MRLGAQPFLWKWVLFTWEWKMISISKAEHLSSFWNRGLGELGNGLLESEKTISLMSKTATLYVHHAFLHILCRHCTTTTWRCLISRFMEDVDKRQWFFLSWSTELKLSIESYFVVFRYELRSKRPEISVFHWRVIQCSFPVPNYTKQTSRWGSRGMLGKTKVGAFLAGSYSYTRRWKSINQSVSCNIALELTVFMSGYAL